MGLKKVGLQSMAKLLQGNLTLIKYFLIAWMKILFIIFHGGRNRDLSFWIQVMVFDWFDNISCFLKSIELSIMEMKLHMNQA